MCITTQAVGVWEWRSEFQGRWERENRTAVFHGFHGPAFPQLSFRVIDGRLMGSCGRCAGIARAWPVARPERLRCWTHSRREATKVRQMEIRPGAPEIDRLRKEGCPGSVGLLDAHAVHLAVVPLSVGLDGEEDCGQK